MSAERTVSGTPGAVPAAARPAIRGTPAALVATFDSTELKGEFVVLVGAPNPNEAEIGDDAIVASLEQALKHESFRDAVRSVADKFKLKRSRVYELGLALERKGSDRP